MTTWTPITNKSSTSWGTLSKTLVDEFLLLEDGFYMLQESGSKIILEQSVPSSTSWSTINKS